jgi:polar amino acid transport system substrate-binding protein
MRLGVFVGTGVAISCLFGSAALATVGVHKENAATIAPPAKIKAAGAITFCTDPTLGPPASYMSKGKHLGSDISIAQRIAALMGVKAVVNTISFNTLIPDIQSGNCDAYIGGLSDTAARARKVDFADYANVGDQVIVLKGNPKHIKNEASLSGHTVSVLLGSTEQAALQAESRKLKRAGKAPITIRVFEQGTAAVQALATGQVDACDQSFPALLALLKAQPGRFQLALPHEINTYPWAIASSKKDAQLNGDFKLAIRRLYANGTIKTILKKAGLGDTALKTIK